MAKEWYKPQEIAAMLDVNKQTVWRWIRDGKLEAVKLGPSSYRVSYGALGAFIEARKA